MIDGRRSRRAPGADHVPADEERVNVLRRLARALALGRRLASHGVTADQVTLVGILLAALTGVLIALGHLWTGVALVTVGGLMDTLDGAVAKAAGSTSRRGAFLDSVSDRIADGFIFGGVAWYLAERHTPELALLPFAILAVGNVISYERAKAELYGWNAKGGLMERAERLIVLGAALCFNVVMIPVLWTLLGLCVVTAVQRFVKIWGQATAELAGATLETSPEVAATGATSSVPAVATATWRPARVESRWRAWREERAIGADTRRRPPASTRVRSRRRTHEPLSTRLRSVLASERSSVPGGASGSRATTRGAAPTRLARRRQDGAAAALRRRLGTGR